MDHQERTSYDHWNLLGIDTNQPLSADGALFVMGATEAANASVTCTILQILADASLLEQQEHREGTLAAEAVLLGWLSLSCADASNWLSQGAGAYPEGTKGDGTKGHGTFLALGLGWLIPVVFLDLHLPPKTPKSAMPLFAVLLCFLPRGVSLRLGRPTASLSAPLAQERSAVWVIDRSNFKRILMKVMPGASRDARAARRIGCSAQRDSAVTPTSDGTRKHLAGVTP